MMRLAIICLLGLTALGCGGESAEERSTSLKYLQAGVPSSDQRVYLILDRATAGGCSATAILGGAALLTAQHCYFSPENAVYTNLFDPAAEADKIVQDGVLAVLHHPTLDASLVILKEPVEEYAELVEEPLTEKEGDFTIAGYGGAHFGQKFEGSFASLARVDESFLLSMNKINAGGGDSGGPLFAGDRLAGIMTNANNNVGPLNWTRYIQVAALSSWIHQAYDRCISEGGEACKLPSHHINDNALPCAIGAYESSAFLGAGLAFMLLVLCTARRR